MAQIILVKNYKDVLISQWKSFSNPLILIIQIGYSVKLPTVQLFLLLTSVMQTTILYFKVQSICELPAFLSSKKKKTH